MIYHNESRERSADSNNHQAQHYFPDVEREAPVNNENNEFSQENAPIFNVGYQYGHHDHHYANHEVSRHQYNEEVGPSMCGASKQTMQMPLVNNCPEVPVSENNYTKDTYPQSYQEVEEFLNRFSHFDAQTDVQLNTFAGIKQEALPNEQQYYDTERKRPSSSRDLFNQETAASRPLVCYDEEENVRNVKDKSRYDAGEDSIISESRKKRKIPWKNIPQLLQLFNDASTQDRTKGSLQVHFSQRSNKQDSHFEDLTAVKKYCIQKSCNELIPPLIQGIGREIHRALPDMIYIDALDEFVSKSIKLQLLETEANLDHSFRNYAELVRASPKARPKTPKPKKSRSRKK